MEQVALWGMALVWIGFMWVLTHWKGWIQTAGSGGRRRERAESHKHFIAGAQLLGRARQASGNKSKSWSLARNAISECDAAISLEPRDAAAHIVKALALEHMGRYTAALRSLNTALSPPASRSLSDSDKADTLLKRAGMNIKGNKGRHASRAAIADVEASLALNTLPDPTPAYKLLSTCYENLGMADEARIWSDKCCSAQSK